ncbi:hypothetical protein ABL78_4882 [Leptomonas seymouri]|uniref:Uncharacterized protein n=1 Tax=Leptomonas seymouri TaxID=5684 RepID=A0A0N1I487_LEPSE|nr:hypothetical protein ABL78_4882 [Leptomonas seymouri]|eukprot:KPI86044.1 hypothetical protein ABL78_4882 [Leptomonas seymouri]
MSTYEWVIEQESPDGVTTRVVFDIAGENEASRGNRSSHHNGSRCNGSSSSHHRVRGGRGCSSALQHQQLQQQLGTGSTVTNALFSLKDTATRSDGGSSKRSSKRSNGSRSRRNRQHHFSNSANGSGPSASNGSMLAPAGSAYTSTALRQRYYRMLFGERGNGGGTFSSVSTRFDPAGSGLSTASFNTRSTGPSNACHTASHPPSTIFMSTYGAELADDDERSSGSYPPRRSRASTNSSSGSGGGGSSGHRTESVNGRISASHASTTLRGGQQDECVPLNAPWADYKVDAARPSTSDRLALNPQSPSEASEPPARLSLQQPDTSSMDYVDDEDRYCHYVKRDVWAARATCPRTVTASAGEFPAFPPLHPIPLGSEAETTTWSTGDEPHSSRRGHDSCAPALPVASVVQQQFRVLGSCTGGNEGGAQDPFPPQRSSPVAQRQQVLNGVAAASLHESRRYNKMLLRKERQRGRGFGLQATPAATATTSYALGGEGECNHSRRRRGGGRTTQAAASQRGRSSCSNGKGIAQRGGTGPGCIQSDDGDDDEPFFSSYDSDDADVDVDSDDSSIECLSNPSSSDDSDAEALRADASFSARVQSLANRAGRERRKLEAREERQLQNEMVRCEEALLTPPMAFVPESPTSPTSPPFSLAAALRERDSAFTMTGMHAATGRAAAGQRGGVALRPGSRSISSGNNNNSGSSTPSSFFISPIHESVAAESAKWTAGTRVQFLGQGGLGGSGGRASAASVRSHLTNDSSVKRRRGRSDDSETEHHAEALDERAEDTEGASAVLLASPAPAPASKSQVRRARKLRKRGDEVPQSVALECGGSRALRPVAPPSIAPPLELLPCSKKEMCEGMLESLLMAAVLEDDDFKLL